MKKLLTTLLPAATGFLLAVVAFKPHPVAVGGGAVDCSARNGDINADGRMDVSDATTILGHLFLGGPTVLPPLCAPPAPAGSPGVPGTGQTACYTFDLVDGLWVEVHCSEALCPGQDGSYTAGCPADGRLVDNGDGTVTDTCTRLMWLKDTADVSKDGQIDAQDLVEWCDGLLICEELVFAGRSDWRLPNAKELQSIVDYGRRDPAIDPVFDASLQYYWSSTSYAESPDLAWGVGSHNGYVGIRPKRGDLEFSFNHVRAVRSLP